MNETKRAIAEMMQIAFRLYGGKGAVDAVGLRCGKLQKKQSK